MPSREWMSEAACRPRQGESIADLTDRQASFFPEERYGSQEARKVCASCPVRLACLEYALETDSRDGVWGGMTERSRRSMHQRATPRRVSPTGRKTA